MTPIGGVTIVRLCKKKISMGEVNANFSDINEMHRAPNEVNHCSLIVLISRVQDTNSHTSISNSLEKKLNKPPTNNKNMEQMSRGLS